MPCTPLRFLGMLVLLTATISVGVCLLPSSRYLRFNSLTEPTVVKAGWIYERIHFDPTPIDVIFIGTSHSVFGIDSERVESTYRKLEGNDLHVVNFAMEHLGRDLHYDLAREAIDSRPVKMLVVEVMENEPRELHPAFAALADPMDLITAPLIINPLYFSNLSRLPLRQLMLSLHTCLPQFFHAHLKFDPALYRGAHWNDTYAERGSLRNPITSAPPRLTHPTAEGMIREREHYEQSLAGRMWLPATLGSLEYRADRYYLQQIIDLAHHHRVALAFLYVPSYRSPPAPELAATYQQYGPIWYPPMPDDVGLWFDVNHLNYLGATQLSDWLAGQLATQHLDGSRQAEISPSTRHQPQ